MACSCGKNQSTPPKGSAAAQAAADRAKAEAAARAANPSTTRIGPARATASGQSQSFALQVGDKTAYFGSALERDAAAVRLSQAR
jgi:hypothetical protein